MSAPLKRTISKMDSIRVLTPAHPAHSIPLLRLSLVVSLSNFNQENVFGMLVPNTYFTQKQFRSPQSKLVIVSIPNCPNIATPSPQRALNALQSTWLKQHPRRYYDCLINIPKYLTVQYAACQPAEGSPIDSPKYDTIIASATCKEQFERHFGQAQRHSYLAAVASLLGDLSPPSQCTSRFFSPSIRLYAIT
ncbi:uncharacterized protein FOMMEDRAFT_152670 [Fomitiporia mediterranea MF3/22]|uniref:uncharacterized protein n=1 Tax=Fomitiporia mediterranea (strain MF3/22) TaxID=694068 RepID=UPI00044078B8|nr:uncharacterized protein FOMMEDRAFT_152670 [Fomitiporia mediterranea MF3/22]EJD05370.1 hypothetical protein FOMMEDRAFT_152670 [Fomitiporia mediterranea MF3/22]